MIQNKKRKRRFELFEFGAMIVKHRNESTVNPIRKLVSDELQICPHHML